MKTVAILMFAILAVGVALPAFATDYTFEPDVGDSGDWNDDFNWNPEGIPTANDKATIPDGKTCLVEDADQLVTEFDVQSGGFLGIVGRQLRLLDDSTINGVLYFESAGPDPGVLRVDPFALDLSGSGTINASKGDNFGLGVIRSAILTDPMLLTLSGSLIVKGSLQIFVDLEIGIDATVKVDHADDGLYVGFPIPLAEIDVSGLGNLNVSAGVMLVGWVSWGGADAPSWTVSGGTLKLLPICEDGGCADFGGDLTVSGGTVKVHVDFCSTDVLDFSGGTIEVDSGYTATFSGVCP